MPIGYRGHCLECGHRWDGLRRSVSCGGIDFQRPDTFRSYSCTRCVVDLYVPRYLNRSTWVRWVSENASELTRSPLQFAACEFGVRIDRESLEVITRSPLLFRACERVAGILATAGSRYAAIPIDIGTIECPDCGDPLRVGELEAKPPACPRCGGQGARWIVGFRTESTLVDYSPLDDAEIRLVVHYLRELAECSKDTDSKETPAFPSVGWPGLLWDRDLDGSTHMHDFSTWRALGLVPRPEE